MKTTFLPKWIVKKILNNMYLWDISNYTLRRYDSFLIDIIETNHFIVRHRIFKKCGIIIKYKPTKEEIPKLATDWLTKTGWINIT